MTLVWQNNVKGGKSIHLMTYLSIMGIREVFFIFSKTFRKYKNCSFRSGFPDFVKQCMFKKKNKGPPFPDRGLPDDQGGFTCMKIKF